MQLFLSVFIRCVLPSYHFININVVFFQDCCLYDLMKDRVKPFSEAEIRNWCFNVFQGLVYMHQHGYFHRDLKPGIFLMYTLNWRSETLNIKLICFVLSWKTLHVRLTQKIYPENLILFMNNWCINKEHISTCNIDYWIKR